MSQVQDREHGSVKTKMKRPEVAEWPIREMIAILGLMSGTPEKYSYMCSGGVLGFWGGVGLMGTIFLLVLVTQRCCSRRADLEKKEAW